MTFIDLYFGKDWSLTKFKKSKTKKNIAYIVDTIILPYYVCKT